MSDQLPPNPSLDHLKYQARNLQRAAAAGDEDALARVEARLPGYAGRVSLAKAQTVIAREYGFPSWPKLKVFVEADKPRGLMPDALNDVQSAFVHAVLADDGETVRELLGRQPELANLRVAGDIGLQGNVYEDGVKAVNEDDPRSCTVLHSAAVYKRDNVIPPLLEAGAQVNALGFEANSGVCRPLELAAWEGTDECVRLLLEAGADPNAITSKGSTPLSSAMWHHAQKKIDLLLEHGAEPELPIAVGLGMADRVRALLEQEPGLAGIPEGYHNRLPMSIAAEFGQRETAEVLIQYGAKVTFIQACGLGMLDYVKTVVEKNRNLVNRVQEKATPLIAASRGGQADVVRYLLGQGADINLAANDGWDDRKAINSAKTADVIDLLGHAGADACPEKDWSPMVYAILDHNKNRGTQSESRDEARVKALARHGGLKQFYRIGRVHLGAGLIEPLLEMGADVNETDENGKTALDHAIARLDTADDPAGHGVEGFTQMIELLQKHGGRRGDGSLA